MAATWKINAYHQIAIDLGKDDIYGLDGSTFEAYYVDKDGNVVNLPTFQEGIKPIDDPKSAKTTEDVEAGSVDIPVDDADGFKKGMVINVEGTSYYYYIEKVNTDDNILTVRKPLKAQISSDTTLKQVGNTGIYGTKFKFTDTGQYFVIINNPSIDLMNRAIKIRAVRHSDQDIYDKIEQLEDKIDALRRDDLEGIILA
jgi:hypothetical protein